MSKQYGFYCDGSCTRNCSATRETIDQAAFASRMDLDQARQCPSFDKFMREVRTLAHPSTSSLSNL